MKLLTTSNSKIEKSKKLGYITYGMHLSPADKSGYNVCPNASEGCKNACLDTAGMGNFSNVQTARINKTLFFFKERESFLEQLWKEVNSSIKSATRKAMKPCFRLNLTSDLPFHVIKRNGETILESFPDVQFYDYTPDPKRFTQFLEGLLPKNYHLTFSRKEDNQSLCDSFLASGGNVATVFRNKLPKQWKGYDVVDGDDTDLRFLDPKNVVVGLVEKGLAKKDETGFVVEVA